MKRKQLLKCALLSLGGITLCITAFFEPTGIVRGIVRREAFFQNRPSSYWREVLREDARVGELSQATIDRLSSNDLSVPVLNECMSDPDPTVRRWALALIAKSTWGAKLEAALRRALEDPDPEIQYSAVRGLGRMGREAFGAATEKLIELRQSNDRDLASAAEFSIWQIAPDIAGRTQPWQTFKSDEWEFTVMLPGSPEVVTSQTEGPFGLTVTHAFMVPFGVYHFSVAVSEFPVEVRAALTVEQRYDSMAEMAKQFYEAKSGRDVQIEHKRIQYNGSAGLEYVVTVDDGPVCHVKSFIVRDRSYMIQVVYPRRDILHPMEIDYYFDSFHVDYLPQPAQSTDDADK